MENGIASFTDFINEGKSEQSLAEFAKTRLASATKISESAKAKGGLAMLTHHHFAVKLPYYKKAAAGKWDQAGSVSELRALSKELDNLLKTFEPRDQLPFQKIMGKIEAIGELIIENSRK
jgi:hypothetical protein